jgi:glycosyltransferase 2 family protein
MKFKHFGSIVRWGTIVATLIFIGNAFSDNWQEVKNIQINHSSCIYLTLALVISLLSHCWSGIIWGDILKNLKYAVPWQWAMTTFLITEPAKYLPGDIWQVYGRLKSGRKIGVPIEVGLVSVILQSVYIAAAGLGFGVLASKDLFLTGSCLLGLTSIAFCIHPHFFAKFISLVERPVNTKILSRFNLKQSQKPQMRSYPLMPIAGQFLFLGLRSIGFILTVLALSPISKEAIVPIIGSFSFAWALGIVSPISGGVGVFEATALSMLDKAIGSSYILGAIILYRLIALMTEVIGAGLGWSIKKSIGQATSDRSPKV